MQNKLKLSTSLLTGLLLIGAQSVYAHDETKIGGFKMPESAIAAKDGRVYVSEIGEFGKDGDGQISVIGKDGKVQVFATGLDDPKGLALVGRNLYVADNKRVLKITPDGKWTVFAPAAAFPVAPQFLNDLESDRAGNIYVSDTGDLKGNWGAVYRISQAGKVTTIVDTKKDARVLGANGLLMDGKGKLLELDFISGTLYRINIASGAMEKIAEGFGGADGITRGKRGILYVSDWKNGKVYEVSKAGEVKLIKEGLQSAADIAISADKKYLLVPDMKAGELVYLPLH